MRTEMATAMALSVSTPFTWAYKLKKWLIKVTTIFVFLSDFPALNVWIAWHVCMFYTANKCIRLSYNTQMPFEWKRKKKQQCFFFLHKNNFMQKRKTHILVWNIRVCIWCGVCCFFSLPFINVWRKHTMPSNQITFFNVAIYSFFEMAKNERNDTVLRNFQCLQIAIVIRRNV